MKQRNLFLKGIVDDMAPNHIKQDNWVFPTHNIRVYNKKGQSYIASCQPGNDFLFELENGFQVIAAQEHRGIVYLISVADIEGVITTQIGCYPYPEAWRLGTIVTDPDNPRSKGFAVPHIYGILRNYNDYAWNWMWTSLFNFTTASNVKLIIDDDFDESANLYICDGINSDKVVNSGFRIDGSVNATMYNKEDFKGKLNHVLYSLSTIHASDVSVIEGGVLPPGQYHLFFSYKTESYDSTEYSSECFPISVAEGNSITSTFGETNTDVEDKQNKTTKKIVLTLSDVDTRYKYLNVGVIRVFSNGEGFAEHEEYQIATNFIIDGTELQIELTGRENQVILDPNTLYNSYLEERISKDHCFFNSRIWKANISAGESYNKDLLKDLALFCTVTSFDDPNDIPISGYNDIVHNSETEQLLYQNSKYIYQKMGYFENETYPFSIIFLLNNGVKTEAFPITGQNEDTGVSNSKGLFKFKRSSSRYTITGVRFYIESVVDAINDDEDFDNIVGFYIARGERIKNLLYDGLIERTANGVRVSKNRKTAKIPGESVGSDCWYYNREDLWFGSEEQDNALHVPVFRYNHYLDGVSFPRNILNTHSFPHATYNDNGKDRSDVNNSILPDFAVDAFNLVDSGQINYEYSIAVEHPGEVADSNNTDDDGDMALRAELSMMDAIDTKLKISDTHFAIFSPDFMTEVEHLTENGNTYFLEVYDSYDSAAYMEGTKEALYKRFDPSDQAAGLIPTPSRTRVYELNNESGYFESELQSVVELRMTVSSPRVLPTSHGASNYYTNTCLSSLPDIPFYSIGKSYTKIPLLIAVSDYAVDDLRVMTLVETMPNYLCRAIDGATTKTYVCIQDTPQEATRYYDYAATPPAWHEPEDYGPLGDHSGHWREVLLTEAVNPDDMVLWSREKAYREFDGATEITYSPNNFWVKAGCSANRYYIETELNKMVYQVNLYNIDKGVYQGRGNFCSYAEDGKEYLISGKKGLYSLTGNMNHHQEQGNAITGPVAAEMNSTLIHYNRSYQTPAYIGVIFPDTTFATSYPKNATRMVRIYLKNPNEDGDGTDHFFEDQLSSFDQKYQQYWTISGLIKRDNTNTILEEFKGDNFKTISWFRMAHHVDFDDNAEEGHPSRGFRSWFADTEGFSFKYKPQTYLRSGYFLDASYSHGILYGMITSNRRNVNLRSDLFLLDEDNKELNYSFFPHVANSKSVLGWIYSSSKDSDLVESLNINDGYNDVSGYVKTIGVDLLLPVDSSSRKTGIAFSERRVIDSFTNGYRLMKAANSVDFETNYGQIMRIEEILGKLVTVRERASFQHFVGQKNITEDLSYDTSLIYLSTETKPLLYYGIQDFFAFMKTKNALYAVDVESSMIFRLTIEKTDLGIESNSAHLLSKRYMIEKETERLVSLLNDVRTTAVERNGIAIGYNEDAGEIYFTFYNGDVSETLVFSETRDFFIGTNDITGSIYSTYKKKMLSIEDMTVNESSKVYINDLNSSSVTFYGRDSIGKLSFIINGNTEQENSVILTKIFESLEITSPNIVFKNIYYETELQKGTYEFTSNSAAFWEDSQWIEGAWFVPIIKQEEAKDGQVYYEDESVFRGKYMKVTLEFDLNNDLSITEVISNFKQSFS